MSELEREKEILASEINDNKAKLLKIVDEKKEWEKEKALFVEKVNVLKEKKADMEKEIEDKSKEDEI